MAGELSNWGSDAEKVKENITAWENRYIRYQRVHCQSQSSSHCLLNFLAKNSESVMKKLNVPSTLIEQQTRRKNIGPITYSAAEQITKALIFADARNSPYDPKNNPNDRLLAENVGILPATEVESMINDNIPTTGFAANQFIISSPSIHKGEPSYSVVMNYCQEFWWLSEAVLKLGCFLYNYTP